MQSTIDIVANEPMGLEHIARHCGVAFSTAWRWVTRGVPGPDGKTVRLQAVRLGGRWVSTAPALQAFTAAITHHWRRPEPQAAAQRRQAEASRRPRHPPLGEGWHLTIRALSRPRRMKCPPRSACTATHAP